jgi:hypothetical protein
MRIEHLLFLDSVSFLPMALVNPPEAFGLMAKSCYPHYINSKANMDYAGRIPHIRYYVTDKIKESEREKIFNGTRRR